MEIAGAQSAYRVLDVLTEVSLNPGATAGEVAKATNLTAPTAHRLLRVLCDRGFAIQNDAGKYVPGPQMRVLAGDRVDRAILEELGDRFWLGCGTSPPRPCFLPCGKVYS